MRFTLAACLALTAVIAVLCFLLTTQPSVVSYLLMMVIIVFAPICALGGILYGRDNLQAFCIGAAIPLALLVLCSIAHLQTIRVEPTYYGSSTAPGPAATGSESTAVPLVATQNSARLTRGPDYAQTVNQAKAMKGRTCLFSIAAILGGGLMMAIRARLQRKKSEPNQPPSISP